MSLLWAKVPGIQPEAMAWVHRYEQDKNKYTPISVRKAGYAGIVGDSERDAELNEGHHGDDEFDEDLYDEAAPEPTHEEHAHYEEHGEYPDSYYERHDEAYSRALQKKKDEDRYDHDDPELMHFIGEHGDDAPLWQSKGHLGKVDIKNRPVYATQTHVAQEHLDRYKNDPHSISWHQQIMGEHAGAGYHGTEHPMFVTHQGRLHTIEGHHRVANALMSGEPHVHGWHFDLDKHPEYGHDEDYR